MATTKKKVPSSGRATKKSPGKSRTAKGSTAKKKAPARAKKSAARKRSAPRAKAAAVKRTRRSASTRATSRRTSAKKPARKAAKKAAAKKVAAKRSASKRAATKRATPRRAAAKKAVRRSAPRRSTAARAAKATTATTSLGAQRKSALASKTVADLKALLRTNDQLTSGSKPELVERILDRVENGNLPRCPQCFLGRLRMSRNGSFSCPGGYDDDEYQECSFTAAAGSIERPAWQFETPGLV